MPAAAADKYDVAIPANLFHNCNLLTVGRLENPDIDASTGSARTD
jgi:hypothetical protein